MSIIPEGEELRRAVKWISERRQEDPDANIELIINEACIRFNISPKDEEFLARCLDENAK